MRESCTEANGDIRGMEGGGGGGGEKVKRELPRTDPEGREHFRVGEKKEAVEVRKHQRYGSP